MKRVACAVCQRTYVSDASLDAHAHRTHRGVSRTTYDPERYKRRAQRRAQLAAEQAPTALLQVPDEVERRLPDTPEGMADAYVVICSIIETRSLTADARRYFQREMLSLRRAVYLRVQEACAK